ncbi:MULTISPECIES: metal-dependent hydrolase family protein [Ruegeria]|uniref:metal-dependent hydrolase family protein n=1 Tax=Ruegeria TaxID=97050 RepID=UPI0014814BD5|nr:MULTISPECIES: amidohydrolase family protein [Ruegeria]NOC91227.1 amidohydrolase family protein [Ruegeria sp. HKCCD6604]UWR08427.1 amidohydrolase family protein [Ruegeria sp. B32]
MKHLFKSTLLAGVVSLAAGMSSAQDEALPQTLFTNVHVFDGVNEARIENASVLVEGNLIKEISTDGIEAPNATMIDGGGRTLMPGMHDQHVHLLVFNPLSDGLRQNITPFHLGGVATIRSERILMNGFTTVRDLGGPAKSIARIIDTGMFPGPRIYSSEAFITQTSGHADFRKLNDRHPTLSGQGPSHWVDTDMSFIADGPEQIRMAVRENLRRGATQIKVMVSGGVTSEFDPLHSLQYQADEIQMAVKTAEQWGTYVTCHVFTEQAIRNCIDNGAKTVEHIPFLTKEAAEIMVEKQIMFATAVAPVYSVTTEQAEAFYTPASFAKWKSVRDAAANMIEVIQTTPGMIDLYTLGTDLINNWDQTLEQDKKMNDEFKYLHEAKFKPFDILRMATSNGARMNRLTGLNNPYQDGPLGVVEEGAYADLLLVDGNPLEDILLLADPDPNLKVIMKDGVIYKNTLD